MRIGGNVAYRAEDFDEKENLGDNPSGGDRRGAWVVAYTAVNAEMIASKGVIAAGFDAYLPCETRKVTHARKIQTVKRPLFPRYLFVRIDMDRPWSQVARVRGVEHLLCNGDIPSRVPDEVISELQAAELIGAFKPIDVGGIKPGDFVEIIAGPFRDFVVEVASESDDLGRIDILLKILGSSRVAKFNIADLRRSVQR